MLITFLFFVPG